MTLMLFLHAFTLAVASNYSVRALRLGNTGAAVDNSLLLSAGSFLAALSAMFLDRRLLTGLLMVFVIGMSCWSAMGLWLEEFDRQWRALPGTEVTRFAIASIASAMIGYFVLHAAPAIVLLGMHSSTARTPEHAGRMFLHLILCILAVLILTNGAYWLASEGGHALGGSDTVWRRTAARLTLALGLAAVAAAVLLRPRITAVFMLLVCVVQFLFAMLSVREIFMYAYWLDGWQSFATAVVHLGPVIAGFLLPMAALGLGQDLLEVLRHKLKIGQWFLQPPESADHDAGGKAEN
jgi:hypothetical protein